MQCAKCDCTIEPSPSGESPAACPKCGAPLSTRPSDRRGSSTSTAILVLLLVAVAAAVGSAIFAMRTVKQKNQAQEDLALTSKAFDAIVVASAGNSRLKGPAAAPAREQILRPAVKYYREIVLKYGNDEAMLPEVAAARLRLAALQAKLGSAECVSSLNSALSSVNLMMKADFAEESYPGFQANVLKIAEPTDWVSVKTPSMPTHAITLFLAIQSATATYRNLVMKYPQSVGFRDDLSALLKSGGSLLALVPGRSGGALKTWLEARDVLETLVRDQPANADFQARLVESLTSAAKLQQSAGETDKALANYTRAVEVRQKMADANPEDKTLKQEVANLQGELEKLGPASAAKDEAAKKDEAPQEESPKADDAPPKDETPKEDAKDAPPASR